MRILLVQPLEKDNHSFHDIDYLLEETKKLVLKHPIDLVVFPESFLFGESPDKCWDDIETISLMIDCPTIIGFSTTEGREDLYYFNPRPEQNDTPSKNYIKHSTAESLLFDWDLTPEELEVYYSPILLNGLKIQVNICHDMFFPLIMERLEREGLDLLINITGGNVRMSKWNNILRGRSIETKSFVLCTMSNRQWMKQPSDRIAYYNGNRIKPVFTKGTGDTRNAFSIFEVSTDALTYLDETAPLYSDKIYEDFTIGLSDHSDVNIQVGSFSLKTDLNVISQDNSSYLLEKGKEKIRVHLAKFESITDRLYVYNQPHDIEEHHVFAYLSPIPIDESAALNLLKLRVIENRIAGIILSPNLKVIAKTNRYKDIQLFKMPSDTHKIGIPLEHIHGFDSVYQKNNNSSIGIPICYKEKYENIIKNYIPSK
ncbi:nitrilase-related carbon-nitrogen hydrolase [Exiguobacterium undae]|uniref:nitrilase-related carbon-nitrogen hydrolase n=1 Tax=Exiguobacterium undae TaxID=169177 RepID=UPI00384C2DE5